MQRRQFTQAATAAAVLGAFPAGFVRAQGMIDTLRIVVGFPPGGTTDAFARRHPGYTFALRCNLRFLRVAR